MLYCLLHGPFLIPPAGRTLGKGAANMQGVGKGCMPAFVADTISHKVSNLSCNHCASYPEPLGHFQVITGDMNGRLQTVVARGSVLQAVVPQLTYLCSTAAGSA